MSDLDALLAAIVANPDDDIARLVYADALDERGLPGDAVYAEYIRVEVTRARLCAREPARPSAWVAARAAFPFGGAARAQMDDYKTKLQERRRHDELFARGRELMDSALLPHDVGAPVSSYSLYRGFIRSISCTAQVWVAHADAILAKHPITEVGLDTIVPLLYSPDGSAVRLAGRERWHRLADLLTHSRPGSPLRFLRMVFSAEWPGVKFDFGYWLEIPTSGFQFLEPPGPYPEGCPVGYPPFPHSYSVPTDPYG